MNMDERNIQGKMILEAVEYKLKDIQDSLKTLSADVGDVKNSTHQISERVTRLETRDEHHSKDKPANGNGSGFFSDPKTWLIIVSLLFGVGNTGAQIIPGGEKPKADQEWMKEVLIRYLQPPSQPSTIEDPNAAPVPIKRPR